jgi:hypothetical protein
VIIECCKGSFEYVCAKELPQDPCVENVLLIKLVEIEVTLEVEVEGSSESEGGETTLTRQPSQEDTKQEGRLDFCVDHRLCEDIDCCGG